MDLERRAELFAEIAQFEKNSQWTKVVEASKQIAQLNLPDLECCVAWLNAATAYGHLNNIDQAIACFDTAVKIESKHKRFLALESKAVFLANNGRLKESISIYRELAARDDLFLAELERFKKNISVLQQNITGAGD